MAVWSTFANGSWITASNWSPAAVPDVPGAVAAFVNVPGSGAPATATIRVNAGASFTVGRLEIASNDSFNYLITRETSFASSAGVLIFDGAGAADAVLDVSDTNGTRRSEIADASVDEKLLVQLDSNLQVDFSNGVISQEGLKEFRIGSDISGAGRLVVIGDSSGDDRLILHGANSFTGGLEIRNAEVLADNATNLGASSISLINGALHAEALIPGLTGSGLVAVTEAVSIEGSARFAASAPGQLAILGQLSTTGAPVRIIFGDLDTKSAPVATGRVVFDPSATFQANVQGMLVNTGELALSGPGGSLAAALLMQTMAEGLTIAPNGVFNTRGLDVVISSISGNGLIKSESPPALPGAPPATLRIGTNPTGQGFTGEIRGGDGLDIFTVAPQSDLLANTPHSYTLEEASFTNWSASDRIIIGGGFKNDFLTGSSMNDEISGGGGRDVLFGLVGADTILGGVGFDTLSGGQGQDNLSGGTEGDVLDGGGDFDFARYDDSDHGDLVINLANSVLNTGAAAGDKYVGIEGIVGGVGDDTITGDGGDNALLGDGGGDVLNDNSGNDTLDGGTGTDSMTGGAGNDTYVVDAAGDAVTEALNAGTDLVQSSVSHTLRVNVENLTLTGTGNTNGTGNGLVNTLVGNSGNNILDGGIGADVMRGGAGDDRYAFDNAADTASELVGQGVDTVISSVAHTLRPNFENLTIIGTATNAFGSSVANILTGNGLNNILNGKEANDIMTGGGGLDTFIFDTALGATNVDRITDFNPVDDVFRLDDAIFSTLPLGTLAETAFQAGTAAADTADRIIYDQATGRIFFDADGAGGTAQVLFALLDTRPLGLSNLDFVIT